MLGIYAFENIHKMINLPWCKNISNANEVTQDTKYIFLINDQIDSYQFNCKQIIISDNMDQIGSDSFFIEKKYFNDAFTEKNYYADNICEIIRNFVAVHTFGDSHSIITHKITICR